MNGDYRIGMDIGGTFTDFVLWHEATGALRAHKRLTTPGDPAEGALAGLVELTSDAGVALADCSAIVHGTTLVTNAVIERRGARTALLTTRGFRDVLEMGREQRYDIHDLFLQFPEPLVPRRWRLEVDERMTRDGHALREPEPVEVRPRVAELVAAGVEALAVCFLHSYRNPAHERTVGDLIRRDFPGLAVSVSSEVVSEIREYERVSTTVCNAYVQPLMDRYLGRLEVELALAGFRGRFFLMQSSGGLATPETARTFPVRLLESGPAGGALLTASLGRATGVPDLLAFDMGGTTAKICLVRDGRPDIAAEMEAARVHRFKRGSGLPIKTPVVDLMEIGAGGGSIARADQLGLLRVGPLSAGAEPGPASYGGGGVEPTVTDACLVLGYFDPDSFLGGTMALDRAAAERALTRLGRPLGLDTTEAAWGVYSVVCESMAAAGRIYVIEKGEDPRRFPIVAFGGAGPAHAARVARALGAPEVVIPPDSGVASALGFLVAPVSFEFSRSYPGEVQLMQWDAVDELYRDMEEQALAVLTAAGVLPNDVRLERRAEMRLAGQFHELEVAVPAGPLMPGTVGPLTAAFEREYRRLYHGVLLGYEPMVLNWRLRASGPAPDLPLRRAAPVVPDSQSQMATGAPRGPQPMTERCRPAYFPEAEGFTTTPVYDRDELHPGARVEGPAIVEERESTTVVRPGDVLAVDEFRNLRITVGVGR